MAGTLFPVRLNTKSINHSLADSSNWLMYQFGKDEKITFLWSGVFELGGAILFKGRKEI